MQSQVRVMRLTLKAPSRTRPIISRGKSQSRISLNLHAVSVNQLVRPDALSSKRQRRSRGDLSTCSCADVRVAIFWGLYAQPGAASA